MDAAVLAHVDGVGDVVSVELYGVAADGRAELVAHQEDVVVVDVDVGKHLAHHGGQYLTRLEQVVDAARPGALDDGALGLRVLAPELLGHHLVDGQREHHLVGVLAGVYLLAQPGVALEDALLERLRLQVVQAEAYLLVVLVAVVVVALQVGLLLVGDHLAHQLHGGVVLAAVARFLLRLDGHLAECAVVGGQADGHLRRGLRTHVDHLLAIAHRADGQSPAVVTVDAEAALTVGDGRHAVSFVLDGGVGHGAAVAGVEHHAGYLCQHQQGHRQHQGQHACPAA